MVDPQRSDGYEVYWPRSPRQVQVRSLASRFDSLNGKRVAQLWDYLFKGDEVFALLEEGLREKFPDIRFVRWSEFGNTHGSEERDVLATLPQRFRELHVDAMISGIGC